MKKVRVWLPFEHGVPYTVEVENPKDLEAIKEAMLKKDPSDWDYDPDFYESLGSFFKDFVKKIGEEEITELG